MKLLNTEFIYTADGYNYTDRTQFVVITHRRGTMEAASVLYGVTMQESGISKLLSLKIDEVSDEMVE